MSINMLLGQLFLGLMNGSFYALLSLGLAVIFGMLHIINFAHGVQYMLGAFAAVLMLQIFGMGYWWALFLAPLAVALTGLVIERVFLQKLSNLNALYGMLFCYGLTLIVQGTFQALFGKASLPYTAPPELVGGLRLPFMFVPYYRLWVIVCSLVVCISTWYAIEKTRVGAYLRAATENPTIVRTFGINVPVLVMLTYSFSVGLAGLAGVLAAPIYHPQPLMGENLMVVVFAVVVIGGMGSIKGSIIAGFGLGLLEGLVSYLYPPASTTAIFVAMVFILVMRPAGLFGWVMNAPKNSIDNEDAVDVTPNGILVFCGILLAVVILAPQFVYPYVLMQAMCFALYALSVGFLIAYAGLMSFGHAMFLGVGGYVAAHMGAEWGVPNELGLISSVVVTALLSVAVGALALRRQGIYFAMLTLAVAQMLYFLALQAPFTHGEDGIQRVPQTDLFGILPLSDSSVMYWVVAILFIGSIWAIGRVVTSPFGEVLKAVRDNEQRAISLGYVANRYKLVAFIISGALAGLSGGLKAIVSQSANLSDMHWSTSGQALLMTLIGGLVTFYGPVIGAFVVFGMMYYFAALGEWVTVAQGALFAACVMLFRRGVAGELLNLMQKMRIARSSVAPAPDKIGLKEVA